MALDLDKPVKTRDGRPVRILCTDRKDDTYPIVALIEHDEGEGVDFFTADGKDREDGRESRNDLLNVSEFVFMNFYPNMLGVYRSQAVMGHATQASAECCRSSGGQTYRISVQEGKIVGFELVSEQAL